MIKTALISVSNKTWIVGFAKVLQEKWIKIISTWGTAKHLNENWITTIDISQVTGFPEMLDGRVKTLHPKIHWWLLALRDNAEHQETIKKHWIEMIDLVVVNLYPFKETIEKPWITEEEAIEQIDIGWPSMLRSASKNFQDVTVIVDIDDYDLVCKQIQQNWNTDIETRKNLAVKVFEATAKYDAMIAKYLSNEDVQSFFFRKKQDLRYWENPHQKAMFLKWDSEWFNVTNSRQLQWKELSYNNIMDADIAWQIVQEFDKPAASIIKHATPCWVALWDTIFEAYSNAYEVDKISPFGWIVALNREVDKKTAEMLNSIFLEIVIAPKFSPESLEVFASKKNLRILETWWVEREVWKKIYRKVWWWLLIQDKNESWELQKLDVVTNAKPDDSFYSDMQFGWKVIKYVKSNAIVIAKNGRTLWVWAGQTNRVKSVRLALEQAKETHQDLNWAVLVSDAFFPFADWIEAIRGSWISCILQPWWSVRDQEVIDKANELWASMVFCHERAFLH